jgi:hypothetical protein
MKVSSQLQTSAVLLVLREKDPLYPFGRRLGELQSHSGRSEGERDRLADNRITITRSSSFYPIHLTSYPLSVVFVRYSQSLRANIFPKYTTNAFLQIPWNSSFKIVLETVTCVVKISGSRGSMIHIATRLRDRRSGFWIPVGTGDFSLFQKSIPASRSTQFTPWFFHGSKVAGTWS